MANRFQVVIVGGGLVGSAIAFGLCRKGVSTAILDEGDKAHRAARANFGLVWVQSKGTKFRPYAALSRQSAQCWAEFAHELRDISGIDVGLRQKGGLTFCYSESEFHDRRRLMQHQFDADLPYPGAYEMLERRDLERMVPGLGPEVVGASYCHLDADVNPLRLLRALHEAIKKLGGAYHPGPAVSGIERTEQGFTLTADKTVFACDRVVLAAGLGNAQLAPCVGLHTPVTPLRGQILVTEKVPPFLDRPTHLIRQTDEGGVLIGDSQEDVGFDDGTQLGVMGTIARRALATFPQMGATQVIRAWGGLRVMTPDGVPLYQRSSRCPGAFAFSVHSGVTLAPIHAGMLSMAVRDGALPESLLPFEGDRLAL